MYMNKRTGYILMAALMLALSSCASRITVADDLNGTLELSDFSITTDDSLFTKASSPAGGSYTITINTTDGNTILKKSYEQFKADGNKVMLPAGDYVLVARSVSEEIPQAAFEQPIYGATKTFSMVAGEKTSLGTLTCTLLQCKVTVGYSDEFLASVTGDGVATVEVAAGYPLEYKMTYSGGKANYEQSAGYFSLNDGANTTLVVTFKGSIEGKSQKMTKSISGLEPRQWRQIKFVKKVNNQGDATFDVVINDFINDEVLGNNIETEEPVIGEDPQAPKGDGDMTFVFDYAAGCDPDITDMGAIYVPSPDEKDLKLFFKATVPNGIKKFNVEISSTNEDFNRAVAAAGATVLDLINPTPDNDIIFQVVPFTHGPELVGMTEVPFDLCAAQDAITLYGGRHTFTMNITDAQGCKASFPIVMIVE